MEHQPVVVGFLGREGVLYCSRECAFQRGQAFGYAVDQDEYETLAENESLRADSFCPGCGAELAVARHRRAPN